MKNTPRLERPDFKDVWYWFPFIFSPIIGGFLAFVYTYPNKALEPLVAINIGVSAPLILKAMANINPFEKKNINPGKGA